MREGTAWLKIGTRLNEFGGNQLYNNLAYLTSAIIDESIISIIDDLHRVPQCFPKQNLNESFRYIYLRNQQNNAYLSFCSIITGTEMLDAQ